MRGSRLYRLKVAVVTGVVASLLAVVPASAAVPSIEKTDYEGKGRVEVEFAKDVSYKNLKISVKDNKGKRYQVKIVDQDSDDLEFRIKKFKCNRTYSYTIKGIKDKKDTSYTTVKGKVKIPAAKTITVKRIKAKTADSEVEFDFKTKVRWKDAKAKIYDENGKALNVVIDEKDSDELELIAAGLKKGSTYQYEISGIRNVDASSYRTIKGSFKCK